MNAVVTKKEAIERIVECSRQLHHFGIQRIALFGSFRHDQAHQYSDVDLLVEFDPDKKSFDNFMDACFLLEDRLGRRVELVTLESLSPYLRPHILKELEDVPLPN